MPDFFETIYAQRAIRKFKPTKIPRSLIESIIDAAIRAPSGSNKQPWSFVVVTEQGKKDKIADYGC